MDEQKKRKVDPTLNWVHKVEDIEALRLRAKELGRMLEMINERIKELEKPEEDKPDTQTSHAVSNN